MSKFFTRAHGWALVTLCAFAPLATAQTFEIYAGGARFVDIPGNQIGLQPGALAATPDGFLYVNDINGRLMRLDTATGLVSAMPATAGGVNLDLGYSYGLAVNFSGQPHAYSAGQLKRIEANGTLTTVGTLSYTGPTAFGPDGSVYVASGNQVFVRQPDGAQSVLAGASTSGYAGDGGPAELALFSNPQGIAVDAAGDIYIGDTTNNRIRKISRATGVISTFAGTGSNSYSADGTHRSLANIGTPYGLVFDPAGNLFVAAQSRIVRIDALSGLVTRVGGGGSGGDGGPALSANIRSRLIALAPDGDIYFSDWAQSYQKIRKIDSSTGILSLAIGYDSFSFCGEDVLPRMACLSQPYALETDGLDSVLFSDIASSRIRIILSTDGKVHTHILAPSVLGMDRDAAGNLFVATYENYSVHRYDAVTGAKTVVAGGRGPGSGGDNGPATSAFLDAPNDVAIDASGNLYISDSNNNRIRRVNAATGIITTFATGISSPGELSFNPAGELVVSDRTGCRLRKYDTTTGVGTTIVGTGSCAGSSIPGGLQATATNIGQNASFAIDAAGNIFLGWNGPHIYRVDAATGILARVPAPATGLETPEGVRLRKASKMTFDSRGKLYITQDVYPDTYIFRLSGVSDITPPTLTPVIVGTVGPGGWYRSNVQVFFNYSDPESPVTLTDDCIYRGAITEDTPGITFNCTATSLGGSTTKTVIIRRDTVAPTIQFGTPNPQAGPDGWHSGDVSIPYVAEDALSGIFSATHPNPVVITGEGSSLWQYVTVSDAAGNTASGWTPTVKIDRSAPTVEASVAGPLGNAGWYVGNAQVSWVTTDPGSPVSQREGCDATTVSEDTTGLTLTCTATSAGGSTTRSVTIKRDATPPTLTFGDASPATDANGWRAAPVSVPFDATDATSGVASANASSPLTITEIGPGITRQVEVTDVAGNIAAFTTPAFNIDGSPPLIGTFTQGVPGSNGWFTSDVSVTFTPTDPEGEILSREGCDEQSVTTDTSGITFTCTATSAGGTATASVTIKRDATAPVVTFGAPSPAANAAGWHTSDVAFAYSAEDATSGVASASHPNPTVVQGNGPGLSTQLTVVDGAGNATTLPTPPVNIDRAAPEVTYELTGIQGDNNWFTTDVAIDWTVSKAPESILAQSGCQDTTLATDTAGITFTCSVTSGAGTTTESVTIKRDATAPVLSFGTPSPVPNSNGWNKTNVNIPFTRSDALSGIAWASSTSPLVLSQEGAGLAGFVTLIDNAGNAAMFESVTRNIDKTPPAIDIGSPADGASYGFYQDVNASYVCDDISPTTCTGPVADGALVNTRTAGARTFRVAAKDSSNFTVSKTHNFTVESEFNWGGFSAPANTPTVNSVARSTRVPIRWRLPDGRGGFITNISAYKSFATSNWSCGSTASTPYTETTSAAAGISFDAASSTFVYNWNVGSTAVCRTVIIELRDGTVHELYFKVQ